MSVGVTCPSCAFATSFHRLPVLRCPRCEAAYPDAVRLPAEAVLGRHVRKRPWLIGAGMYLCASFGGLMLLFVPLAAFDIGNYSIGDQSVSGGEFLRRAGVFFVGTAAYFLAVAYGIWKERTWARPAMMAFWLGLSALDIGQSLRTGGWGLAGAIFWAAIYVGIPGGYLFAMDSVVGYYQALAMAEQADQPDLAAPAPGS